MVGILDSMLKMGNFWKKSAYAIFQLIFLNNIYSSKKFLLKLFFHAFSLKYAID